MRELLKKIAEISAGQSAPQGDSNYCDHGIPFVKAGNLQELIEGKNINDIQKVSQEVAKKYQLKLFNKGTIVFAKSGMSCLKGYVYVLPSDAYVVNHLACITPYEDISEYLQFYFNYHKPNKLVRDAAYPSIRLNDISELEIDIKDSEWRSNIVAILNQVRGIIKKRNQEIRCFDELIRARFVETFGAPREDVKGWGLTTLEKCCQLNPRRPKGINDDLMVSFVPMTAVSEDGQIDCSDIKPYKEVKKGFTYFAENDVLFAKITPCMENGKGAVAEGLSGGIGAGSTEFHVLRPIPGISNPCWLYTITMFDEFRKSARIFMTGTGGQLRVPVSYLKDYPISLPPIELQNEFERFVRKIYKSKLAIQKSLEETQLLFDSLMQKYFG